MPIAFLDFPLLMFATLHNLVPTSDPPFKTICDISSRQAAELRRIKVCEQLHVYELSFFFRKCLFFFFKAGITLSKKYGERKLRRLKLARDLGKTHRLGMNLEGQGKAVVP